MNKHLIVTLITIFLISFTSCSNHIKNTNELKSTSSTTNFSNVDVDLTDMSSTMVYAEVYNMVMHPENYIGKTVKMKGEVSVFTDNKTKKTYYSCIIADATACCSQGIEFELNSKYKYPKEKSLITLIGSFDTYKEDNNTYCTLRDSSIIKSN